ncbi:MAG: thioredoxin [Myxococcales bacterium]|nr:thioredoxin [Myxococcales bacterium]
MQKEYAIIAIVATAVVCFVAGYVLGTSNVKEKAPEVATATTEGAAEGGNAAPGGKMGGAAGPDSDVLPVGESATKGNANAAVTIVEFSEFQCPFCSRVLPTVNQIMEKYPNDVRIVFKHNPLSFHKDAPLASEAAMAAGEQGKFWEYHDILFKNQKALKRPELEKYAEQLGLDMAKFKAALDQGKFKEQIKKDQALASKGGARGTPNFFVNGIKVVGAKPFPEFQKIIDGELAAAKGSNYAARVKANYKKDAPAANKPGRPPRDDKTIYKVELQDSPVKGGKDALVTIVEFSDFQCPFCGRVNPTLAQIQKEYGDKVRISFKQLPLPFHKDAFLAAEAALAAGEQGKFWEYHDILFQNQKALKRPDLEKYAEQLQLNMGKFKAALDSNKFKKQVEQEMAMARKVGARGTPHFFVNGKRLSGAQPFPKFKEAVEDALKRAKPLTDKGMKGDALYAEIMKTAVAEFKAPAGAKRGAPPQDNKVYDVPVGNSPVKGNPNAKVAIVEFSDFQCPFCSRVNPTMDALQKKYGDKIKIAFKHQPLPFHKDAFLAAEASLAAHEQGKFWEYHDILFQNQKALKRPELEKYAEQLGLNMAKFKAALDSNKFKKQVEEDQALARKVGANGTPTLFVNGKKLVGAQPAPAFEKLIDEALK